MFFGIFRTSYLCKQYQFTYARVLISPGSAREKGEKGNKKGEEKEMLS